MARTNEWQNELDSAGAVFGRLGVSSGVIHFRRAEDEYRALVDDAGVADFSDWTQIELRGKDRASLLHNMCTNEVRKLAAGSGCEAFFLDAKGHIVGHGFVFAGPDSHLLFGVPGQAQRLMAHLDRYIIREDVQLADQSGRHGQFLVAGPRAGEVVKRWTGIEPPSAAHGEIQATVGPVAASIRALPVIGPIGFVCGHPLEQHVAVWRSLVAAGARPCGLEAVEMARVEHGFPVYGRDISERNLPQEVGRDDRAISFVKGCYIGQETVARIDALGHVNRKLVGLKFSGTVVPEPELALSTAGQVVGEVTSAVYSPRLAGPLALGYVRRGHDEPGTQLDSPLGKAQVVKLPL
jgi:folate-binding protein YgfZ